MLDYTTPLNRKKTPALGIGDQQRKPEPETPAPPTLEATTAPAAESPVMQTAKTKTPVEKGGGNPIKSFGKNVWAGMLSGATSFNKMIGLGHSDFTKEMFITPGEKKAQRIREETMSDSFLQNFSNDFALGLGSMASTIPMDVASGGAAKVALAGKLVPKVSALLSSMPDFAVGMGIHGGLEAAQEDPSVSNVLITAGERAAFGTLYGKLGTSLASIPKFAALGAGEAVYDAAKRGEVPSMKDIAESTGHGVSMGVLFYFLPKMAASTKILAEKKAIYQLNSSLNKAVKTKDYKFLKPKLKQFLDNESIRPKVKAAIFEMVKPLQGEKAKGKKAEPKERRADEEYRKRVSEMTMEERETALLRHELTGLKNRRSYEETEGERLPFQASLDVDGLKFINDVVGGHPVGDVLLKRIGGALERAGKEYAEKGKSEQYHISGDEFIIEGSSPQHIEAVVSRAKEILKSEPIEFAELGTGEKVKYTPDFSHGIARDLKTADKFMIENKAERRVKRGEGELITENPQRLALSVENKFQNAAETNLDRFKEWVNQHDKDTINTASDLLMDQGMRLGNENPKAAIKIVSHARWLKNQALQKSPTKTSTQKALENDAHGKAIDEALNSPELEAERAAMETKVRPPEEVVPPPEQPPLSLSLATEAKKIGAEFIGMTEDGVGGFRPQFQDAKTGSSFTVRPNESVAQAQLRSREAFVKSQKKKLTPEEQALIKKYGGEVKPPVKKSPVKELISVTGRPKLLKPILNERGTLDIATTKTKLPPVKKEHTRLFRVEKAKGAKGRDIPEALKKAPMKDEKGNYYTDDLKYADYYKEAYGKDAQISYIDVPNAVADKARVAGTLAKTEYIIDVKKPKVKKATKLQETADLMEGKPTVLDTTKKVETPLIEQKALKPASPIDAPPVPPSTLTKGKPGPPKPPKAPESGEVIPDTPSQLKQAMSRAVEEIGTYIANKNIPIRNIQKKLKNVREDIDLFLQESQRPKVESAKVREFWDERVEPLLMNMAKSKLKMSQLEEYAHAKHVPEANAYLRKINAKRFLESAIKAASKEEAKLFKKVTLKGKRKFTPDDFLAKLQEAFDFFSETKQLKKVRKSWEKFIERPAGMTDTRASKILAKYKDNKAIEAVRLQLKEINDARLDVLYDAGVIPKETYQQIKNNYEFFTPLMREGFEQVSTHGKGIQVGGNPLKMRKGSERDVVDIVANSVARYQDALIRAERAKSEQILVNLVKENPDPGFWSISEVKKAPTYDTQGNVKMYPSSLDVEPNQIRLMVNGRQKLLSVDRNNRTAMLMLKTLKAEGVQSGAFMNAFAKANRWFAKVSTTWSPEFLPTNFVKDLQTAGINIHSTDVKMKQTVRGVKDSVKAIYHAERGNLKGTPMEAMYERFKAAGGKIGFIDAHSSIPNLAKKLNRHLEMKSGQRPVRKVIKGVADYIEDLNTSIENGIRLHVFKLAVEQGKSDKVAANIASNLTVDFTQKGTAGPAINAFYLFANANIQGSYRIMQAMAKSRTVRYKIAPSIIAAGFTNGMYNNYMGGTDVDGDTYYNKIEDFVKERNAVFMVPGTEGKHVKSPLPWGYNFFWGMGNELSRVFTEKDYSPMESAVRLAVTFANAFNPVASGTLLQTVLPTLADPIAMVAENKNWFGGELMPEENPYAKYPTPDSQRYWKSASPPSKWVANKLNSLTGGNVVREGKIDVSPETLDLIMDTAGGSMLKFFKDTFSLPFRIADKELQMNEVPFLRRAAGQKTEWTDSRVYYENVTQILTADAELETYRGTDQYDNLVKKVGHLKPLIPYAKDVEYQLRTLRKQKREYEAQGRKSMVEKLEKKIIAKYQRFNKRFNQKQGR